MSTSAELLMLKGAISELPEERREKIISLREQIKTLVVTHGDDGLIALAIVGAELSAT